MRASEVIGGVLPKVRALDAIKKTYKVKEDQICFVGDDLIDVGVMKKVGLPIAVADAPQEVKKQALFITKRRGGEGAVREIVEHILKSQGIWPRLLKEFDKIVRK
jgi:3-deoxy-D-manno-octulosonate 8-phosphate phosphatase (KDO 8-P phosphatase)